MEGGGKVASCTSRSFAKDGRGESKMRGGRETIRLHEGDGVGRSFRALSACV